MEGILKVTPEKLIQASTEFSSTGKTISTLTQEMTTIINGLKTIWQGDASTTYGTKFNGLQDDIEKINRMIQEHVTDLNEMAREYQSAETANVDEGAKLLTEVIV
ncbi:MAG TPA: WXG100 family type VII secretion target [Lachnospiraceae bacterium]|jgi:WXG100 family type VII secretion target|nr:WXG100 family type VII secretion target [Lachnospiraceae bacterium]